MTRVAAVARPTRRSERFVYWLSSHWLLAFNVLWGIFDMKSLAESLAFKHVAA